MNVLGSRHAERVELGLRSLRARPRCVHRRLSRDQVRVLGALHGLIKLRLCRGERAFALFDRTLRRDEVGIGCARADLVEFRTRTG